jgi:hypothetical protein
MRIIAIRAIETTGVSQEYSPLANAILFVHFALVIFIIAGVPLVYLGAWRHWRWVRAWPWRLLHLAAIACVAAESVLGIPCPLTTWEDTLRANQSRAGFLERWVARVMFIDLPPQAFTLAYVLFAVLVVYTWFKVPPSGSQHCRRASTGALRRPPAGSS